MTKVKNFISQSSHKFYFDLISKLLDQISVEQKKENNLVIELIRQKEDLEQLFVQYKERLYELHRLIVEYQIQQIQIRKKIRQVQLNQKGKD